ncbi:MAG TPA: FkbM family methyltransferase [Isosphaeraceae bacterium]|jgi:FkbM family methyltransferase
MSGSRTMKTLARARVLLSRALTGGRRDGRPDADGLVSYAQQGEDMILHCLFQGHGPGFFVDVGAHHPWRFSNTYFFYLRGWRGINIDAMPGSMDAFRAARPEDVNLECAVAEARGSRTFYQFDEPAVNGLSREMSEARAAEGYFRPVCSVEIPTTPLAEILDTHVPSGRSIDFLTVDAEGLDLEVLRSNDWPRFRPKVVVVEDSDALLVDDLGRSEVAAYLRGHGYRPCAKSVHSLFLADERRLVKRPDRFFAEESDSGLRDGETPGGPPA